MLRRSCPICGSTKSKTLYIQKYSNGISHTIVTCSVCGFVYVKNIPDVKETKRIYSIDTIYEYTRDEDIHKKTVAILKKYINIRMSILDVGCATGNLLYLLKCNHYQRLLGIDPAPNCRKIAQQEFGINVITASIESFRTNKTFDLIILNNVLEHLSDVRGSIEKLLRMLNDGGFLYMALPDAENFYKVIEEPFYEFSLEHINFFTKRSLRFLLHNCELITSGSDNRVLYALWKKDKGDISAMNMYIRLSEMKLKTIIKFIERLPRDYMAWGSGSLARRLVATTKFKPKYFIDRNQNLMGSTIGGIATISPQEAKGYIIPIVVMSYRYKGEISKIVRTEYKNKIYLLP